MRKIPFAVFAVAAVLAVSGDTKAASMSTSFNVTATVVGKCQKVGATDINFGTVPAGAEARANGSIEVTCNEGVHFEIRLDGGAHHTFWGPGGLLAGTRNMAGPAPSTAELLGYQIYHDAGLTDTWGNQCVAGSGVGFCLVTLPPSAAAGIGTGSPLAFTTFGRIFAGSSPSGGNYVDTVNVEVVF